MIYHSHPQESFNPVLGTNVDNPSSAEDKKNVGLVGEALAKELERRGVAALHKVRKLCGQGRAITTITTHINIPEK